jgi:hypothetical protein
MHCGDATPLQRRFQAQIEIRRVDADKDVRWLGEKTSNCLLYTLTLPTKLEV